jgi:hypothetical protein
MANRQPRRQHVKSPPPEEPDFIWDEWVGPASAPVHFWSRWGLCSVSFGPSGVGQVDAIRIGFPKPQAATPPVPASQGQTKTRSKRPPRATPRSRR